MYRDKRYGLVSSKQELELLKELDKELKHDEFKVTISERIKAKNTSTS